MKKWMFILLAVIFLFACNKVKNNTQKTQNPYQVKGKLLNITILLDLSDRIDPEVYPAQPSHYKRDMELIKTITEIFKQDMEKKGAYLAKEKIRLIFSPMPNDPEINNIVKILDIDLSKYSVQQTKEKKKVFDTITGLYQYELAYIYDKVLKEKHFIGADIWRFFKDDVRDFAIDPDTNYRNILVIITDGYLYHPNSIFHEGNRTSYIGVKMLNRLRGPNWHEKFVKGDYGILNPLDPDEKLDNLEVLVLELTPKPAFPNDIDILKTYWKKWLREMGVKHYAVYASELPTLTEKRIKNFFALGI